MTLEIVWYLIILICLSCYVMLDGFDLGVGMLHLLTKNDADRRVFLNAIGPVWDGNEVWLVVVAGALFAGFPAVFATLFTAFYIPLMLLLMGLIFRAVSIEFRSKSESKRWRQSWDLCFSLGSFIIAFGVGVFFANLILGIPLNENNDFVGSFVDFISLYSVVLGLTAVSLFMMHGSIFLVMKTEGKLHDKLRGYVPKCIAFFITMYIATTVLTLVKAPYMAKPLLNFKILFLIPILALAAICTIPALIRRKRDGLAFIFSALSMPALLSLSGIGTYPYMVRSTIDLEHNSLLIFNAASSRLTLKVLLTIVAIGIPLVLAYGVYIYRIFRGKVRIDSTSY